ncbi:MAG: hypothetical protein JWQ35_847 [Bacteriovoracaceae bacterium]|nr:hypothetical protein [Bacteriovoracaceae bacterium]
MSSKKFFKFSILSLFIYPTFVLSQTVDISDVPCMQRGFSYCQLPNLGDNCSVGTCSSSLSSSGNCTIEAIYTDDHSAIASCRVCSSETISSDSCTGLGGTVKSSS